MTKTLNNESDVATERTNDVGNLSPILEIQPDDGTGLLLDSTGETRGKQVGLPIFMKLRDSAGNELPQGTNIVLRAEVPGRDERFNVSLKYDNIASYNRLSLSEQTNEERIDATKFDIKGGSEIQLTDNDTLYLSVETDKQIDWTNSRLEISRYTVTEVTP